MRKTFHAFFAFILVTLGLASCGKDDAYDEDDYNKQTVIVYMPWSGTSSNKGLYDVFQQNLDSIESAIVSAGSIVGRVVVYINTSATEAELYEISYVNKEIVHTPIKTYSGTDYTTAEGITQILNDVQANAWALNYCMMIGCHGYGWTYKDDWEGQPYYAKAQATLPGEFSAAKAQGNAASTAYPTTRYFGSYDATYGCDVADLAKAIAAAGMKMQFIMFDDCYMANVETAYELRDVTNYILASTSEVMAIGVPYQTMWKYLASATPNYSSAISAFGTFYSSYTYPYGTLSAIDCRELSDLAYVMLEINRRYSFDETLRDSLQVLDGFSTPIFYDLGDYVEHLCDNATMLSDFNDALSEAVPYESHTDSVYSYLLVPKFIKLDKFSGITVSDPSQNTVALRGMQKTAWWAATHDE